MQALHTRKSSIVLVFKTSRGVVNAAAKPPAILPQSAASCAPRVVRFNARARRIFKYSYRGNWIDVNGILSMEKYKAPSMLFSPNTDGSEDCSPLS